MVPTQRCASQTDSSACSPSLQLHAAPYTQYTQFCLSHLRAESAASAACQDAAPCSAAPQSSRYSARSTAYALPSASAALCSLRARQLYTNRVFRIRVHALPSACAAPCSLRARYVRLSHSWWSLWTPAFMYIASSVPDTSAERTTLPATNRDSPAC